MKTRACLDAGVLSLFLSKDRPLKIQALMEGIKKESIEACVLAPVLSEVFFHVCKLDGIERAKVSINSLINDYPINIIDHDTSLIVSTGTLKCQHRKNLSYIDCMSIAFCLNNKIPFHTTEKKLKKIPGNVLKKLRTITYSF